MAFQHAVASKNITLGKGVVSIAKHTVDNPTAPANGYRDVGNCPGLSLSVETETLEHFSSRGGVQVKDLEVVTRITMTGTLNIEDMDPKNLAAYFLGAEQLVSAGVETDVVETLTNVEKGLWYQLGTGSANPSGDRKITVDSVETVTGSVPLVLGTDYDVDANRGYIVLLEGGTVVTDLNKAAGIKVTYDVAASTRQQVVSGTSEFRGSLQFHSESEVGVRNDWLFPSVRLRPNGEFALIGEEWMQVSFQFEALAAGAMPAVLLNGQPYTA